MRVVVVTKIPSPYQVELFDKLAKQTDVALTVIYVRRKDSDRFWRARPLNHDALFLDDSSGEAATRLIEVADLVVFSWYRDRLVRTLIALRSGSGKPWCFWGERPGFNFPGAAGMLFRRWMLRDLYFNSHVPIWGIGKWAIDRYVVEFGSKRDYYNVPYVSNLGKFFAIPDKEYGHRPTTVLFSGALIARKGVMELCVAFCRIAKDMPHVTLKIMGAGPLEKKIRKMVNSSSQIQLLGFRDWDELQKEYSSADFLCAPSRHDGWGLIVIEGLAAGLPVIATSNVGAACEVIETGRNGWLIPPFDGPALESCLREALSLSSVELDTMSANCRATAVEYDIATGAARFMGAAKSTQENWPR